MKDYYLLVRLNSKKINIITINQNDKVVMEVLIENKKRKLHNVYLYNFDSIVNLIIYKKKLLL